MNGQDLARKLKAYPVASAALAVTIILILAIYFRGLGQSGLEDRYESASKRWKQVESNVFKNSVNLETHLETAEGISQDVKERLIRPSELAKNHQYFYRLQSLTGVRITSLQQEPPAPSSARDSRKKATAKEEKPAPLFSEVNYTMTVAADFHKLLEFMHALEHGYHFYQLRGFTLQRVDGEESRDINITMNFTLLGTP